MLMTTSLFNKAVASQVEMYYIWGTGDSEGYMEMKFF
jgi:hypothetical protein